MNTFGINELVEDEELAELAELADIIWHECFPGIISVEQIDYMVEKFQSLDAIRDQTLNQDHHYFGTRIDGVLVGYFGVAKQQDGSLYLSKLYLRSDMRMKGLSSLMFKEIKRFARRNGCELIWLTVNKGNEHAINVYKHLGMRLLREQKTDIGNGFFMDDYVFGIMV